MRKYKAVKVLFFFFLLISVVFILLSSTVLVGGVMVKNELEEFKSRGVYIGTFDVNFLAYKRVEFYEVKKEYNYEFSTRRIYDTSSTSDVTQRFTDKFIGDIGDIYVASRDPLGTAYTAWASSKIMIGHCGIVYSNDGRYTYEVVGNQSKEDNVAKRYYNNWLSAPGPSITVLRTKQEIDSDSIVEWCDNHTGKPYNYLFPVKAKNSYYCSDLVSRCIKESNNIEVSTRERLVSGGSMILNDNTYIIYHRENSETEGVDYKVYFLSED